MAYCNKCGQRLEEGINKCPKCYPDLPPVVIVQPDKPKKSGMFIASEILTYGAIGAMIAIIVTILKEYRYSSDSFIYFISFVLNILATVFSIVSKNFKALSKSILCDTFFCLLLFI